MDALYSLPVGSSNARNGSTVNEQQQHKTDAWSNCDAAAAAAASSSETLFKHMRNTLLNCQNITPVSSTHAANVWANTHNLSSGLPSLASNPFHPACSTQVNPMLGSLPAGQFMNLAGNIFDHPSIKNPALQPTPIVQASGRPHSTLSLLEDSLETLLQDESFGLDNDALAPLLRQDPAARVFPKGSLNSMPKRMCPTGHMLPNVKRQRTGYELTSRAPRFRPYQERQWQEQFDELLKYKEKYGNCLVPHTFEENQTLSRWVKRQRYQYKLMKENKVTTMTDSRVIQLEEVGFIWDSHSAAWHERLGELEQYLKETGDSHVPSNCPENPQLATWVKCQRRQGKLFFNGRPSNMTRERATALNRLGFSWGMRHGL
ncbi:MAG: hypothetical protein SGBAC_000678 [Bacillariaceae sp.]